MSSDGESNQSLANDLSDGNSQVGKDILRERREAEESRNRLERQKESRQYITQTLSSTLEQLMIATVMQRPLDPHQYMKDWLILHYFSENETLS